MWWEIKKKKKTKWKKLLRITASISSLPRKLEKISRLLDKYDIEKSQHFPDFQIFERKSLLSLLESCKESWRSQYMLISKKVVISSLTKDSVNAYKRKVSFQD